MAGRKFNFAAAEADTKATQDKKEDNTPTEKPKNKTAGTHVPQSKTDKPEPNGTLAGKAGTLTKKLSSPPGTKAFDFRFIPRDKLRFYEDNDYAQENIESLAEKILDMGLIHNLEAFYVLDTDTYTIDSGERRCRALDLLIDRYRDCKNPEDPNYQKYARHVKQFENGYPCNVRLSLGSEDLDMLELRIRHYVANEEIRDRDPAKTAKRIAELNTLYALRNNSSKKKININKKIGEDLGISDRQVKKYKSVQKLIPELKKKFEENEITLSEGSNYAALSTEEQGELLRLINSGAAKKEIEELYRSISAMRKDICEKEDKIKSLEDEKTAAQDETRRAQEETAMLREKLLQESSKKSAEPEKIKALKKEVEESASKLADLEKKHKNTMKAKDRQIEILKNQIKQQKDNTATSGGYREATKLDIHIRQLREASNLLKESYDSYKKAYREGLQSPPAPTEYRREILEILESATKMIK